MLVRRHPGLAVRVGEDARGRELVAHLAAEERDRVARKLLRARAGLRLLQVQLGVLKVDLLDAERDEFAVAAAGEGGGLHSSAKSGSECAMSLRTSASVGMNSRERVFAGIAIVRTLSQALDA